MRPARWQCAPQACIDALEIYTSRDGLAASMRVLFLGDVVGRSGRRAVIEQLPRLRERYALNFVIVNAENAAGGFGITEPILMELLDAGADAVTTGNHVFDQREALVFIERQERLLRPLNFPPGTPGRGTGLYKAKNGADVLVINAQGRVFMGDLDDPFRAVERELDACGLKAGADAIIVDFHAEATSEKEAMGFFVDGRASALIGTHTHVPTADEQILPSGTGYISDAGMCGDFASVLGMEKEEPLQRFLTKIPSARFSPSQGEATLCGVALDIDDATGLARAIAPLRLGGRLSQTEPAFWL
jgi:2',3'-cyclic-nucleotide 2'-phosphodiesterase